MPLLPGMQPKEFLEIFLRRKWLIIFSNLFILFGASVYCVMTPEMFKSSTTILVVAQRVPENYVKSTISIKIEDRLSTIQQQVLSRTRLLAVMDELGLFKDARKKQPVEVLVDKMRKRIGIEVRQKDVFTLSFVDENRHVAMLTASRLASYFIDENLKTREQQAVGTADFLDSQLQETKKKLEVQEERVRRYKSAYMGELPEQLQANLQILSRLQDQAKSNSDAIRSAQDRKMFVESQIVSLEAQANTMEVQARAAARNATADNTNPAIVDFVPQYDPAANYIQKLDAKRAQLDSLSTKYTARYPEIQRLKKEVSQLEKLIGEVRGAATAEESAPKIEKTSMPTPARSTFSQSSLILKKKDEIRRFSTNLLTIDAEIGSLKKESAVIRKSIAAFQDKVDRSPKREQEMISLTRDYENLKRSYDDLLKKKLDADVAQNLEKRQKGEQFQILDPANLPEDPFFPNRPKVFGIAILAALLLGFGGAVGLEMTDPSVRDVAMFRRLTQIPVLATIPIIKDNKYERELALRKATVFGVLITFTGAITVFLILHGDKIRAILQGVRWHG